MDRRGFLRGAAVAAAVAGGIGSGVPAAAAQDGAAPPISWLPTSLSPVLSLPQRLSDANTQRSFATLLPVRDKLGSAAIDDWYLWLWTHDTSRTYLYTAPSVVGPYTARGFGEAPTPFPPGYQVGHFSAGDIVWDPDRRRFVSTPHGVRLPTVAGNAEPSQDSFLTESVDGLHWEWLDQDSRPRLVCGPPRSVDSVHTGYGRLLRDLDGAITTHAGRYWWIYRAQRNDAGNPLHALTPLLDAVGTTYTPYLASAPTLAQNFDRKRQAFVSLTLNLGLHGFGSFVRAGGAHHVYITQGLTDPPIAPSKVFYNRTLGDTMDFLPTAVPFVLPTPTLGAILEGDGNVVRDPATGATYLCHTCSVLLPTPTVEVWIYRSGPV